MSATTTPAGPPVAEPVATEPTPESAEPSHTVRVDDVFELSDGRIAFTGFAASDVPRFVAGTAELCLNGGPARRLTLEGEPHFTRPPIRKGDELPTSYWSATAPGLPDGLTADQLRTADVRVRLVPVPGSESIGTPPPSNLRRPLTADDAEACFLRQGIRCERGENNLVYVLRTGTGARPPKVWISWSAFGQGLQVVYRDEAPRNRVAVGGVTTAGIVLLRGEFNRYSVPSGSRDALHDFLAAFGIEGERAVRVLRASGITVAD